MWRQRTRRSEAENPVIPARLLCLAREESRNPVPASLARQRILRPVGPQDASLARRLSESGACPEERSDEWDFVRVARFAQDDGKGVCDVRTAERFKDLYWCAGGESSVIKVCRSSRLKMPATARVSPTDNT